MNGRRSRRSVAGRDSKLEPPNNLVAALHPDIRRRNDFR